MSTEVCPSGRENKASDWPTPGRQHPTALRRAAGKKFAEVHAPIPEVWESAKSEHKVPLRLFWVRAPLSASPKLERSQGHLRPGQGGLRLLTAKFSKPPRRPRLSSRWPPSSPRPVGAEGGSEARTEGRRASAGVAPSPAPRAAGSATRAAPSQCRPRHVRPLASRPPRPERRARPRAYAPPDLQGGEERRAGTGRSAPGRSLPLHHASLDLDLSHARIGHGP